MFILTLTQDCSPFCISHRCIDGQLQEEEFRRQRAAEREAAQKHRLKEALALLQASGRAQDMRDQVRSAALSVHVFYILVLVA